MLPIDGQPLIDIWLEAFADAGVQEVLVNLHYLPDVVQKHLDRRTAAPSVRTVFEPTLLGSAGTLAANKRWVEGDDVFLACYADNLTDWDLSRLVRAHQLRGAVATLTLFHAPEPSACGIVEIDPDGLVIGFEEKPSHPSSDLANAGMYAFHPEVLEMIPHQAPSDIGYDLLPHLVGRAHATVIDGYLRDIGTPTAYQRAQEEWRSRVLR
jgi:mannose-1-phosphate guanylyltransferase